MFTLMALTISLMFKLCWWCIYYGAILAVWSCKALWYVAVALWKVTVVVVVALIAVTAGLAVAIQRRRTESGA